MTPRPSKLDPFENDIRQALAAGKSYAAVARALGVSVTTLKDFCSRNDLMRTVVNHQVPANTIALLPDTDDPVSREEVLEQENRELRSQLKKRRKFTVRDERVLRAIERALEDEELPVHRSIVGKQVHYGNEVAHHRQAVILSDWHIGEIVDPGQVHNLNAYDWAIAKARVDEIAASLISFKKHRPHLTGLDIWFLGDMVNGNIHEELVAGNEFPVAEQSVKVGHLMGDLVNRLAPHYHDLHVEAISGNHGRTKKDHANRDVFDSWDWTAYNLAAAASSGNTNVVWNIPRSGISVRRIAGLNILLFHGDGIRSSMPGVPWGGVLRRMNELRKEFAARGVLLDGAALGHFHQPNAISGNIWVNGALPGITEYGIKNFGGGAGPCQLLVTFDEKAKRVTDTSYITPTAGIPVKA